MDFQLHYDGRTCYIYTLYPVLTYTVILQIRSSINRPSNYNPRQKHIQAGHSGKPNHCTCHMQHKHKHKHSNPTPQNLPNTVITLINPSVQPHPNLQPPNSDSIATPPSARIVFRPGPEPTYQSILDLNSPLPSHRNSPRLLRACGTNAYQPTNQQRYHPSPCRTMHTGLRSGRGGLCVSPRWST